MRMNKLTHGVSGFMALLVVTLVLNSAHAQAPATTLKPIDWNQVAEWKKKVEAHPDSIAYHKEFIKSLGWDGNLYALEREHKSRFDSAMNMMENQYKIWSKQFPKSANSHYVVGSAFWDIESPKATPFLKAAAALDPSNADAFFRLSIDAERWGDSQAGNEYMRLASIADPSNPAYLFYYAANFRGNNLDFYREKVAELVKKFPDHERAAQGLYWLAYETKNREEKIKVYEELRDKYSPEKFKWSESGMSGLFDQYLFAKQFDKALDLSASMISKRGWKEQHLYAISIAKIQKLMDAGEFKVAYDSMVKLKGQRGFVYYDKLSLVEAELADKTGNTLAGYEKLLLTHAKSPTDELENTLLVYGQKMGKNAAMVNEDIWKLRNKTKKPAYPFDLGLYTSKKNAKLADYKGKVVLLTFWFPGCGPCRAEFPYFENVVKKFNKKELAYLGINVFPNQDEYVLPFMNGTKYSFTPLKATNEWAEKHYGVRGQPTNFLLDKEGNIVYSNFRTDNENERTLELMIQSLLK